MRWLRVRKAEIDPELRETFERHGIVCMTVILGTTNCFRHKGENVVVSTVESSLLQWLTEQYDRAERRETWLITMEAAVTLFVAIEVIPVVVRLIVRGRI